ncbi:hypothetical protein XMD543_001596 [Marinobacterium sp. xm-d-543]|uniref:hypothetical protein n=1 Tax=Marinobacterium sp. xm-d-543 TaxID=2497740 RepID=UPI0015698A98|nr:hypothetical protein [Marinobacterium sp. xm-d-543]NRP47546.1 hypothetical protein [Marinobacterium sp. xm-d-543]
MLTKIGIPLIVLGCSLVNYKVVAGERIHPEIEIPIGTTTMCVGRDSNGFTWRNGDWVRAGFFPSKYILKKMPQEYDDSISFSQNPCMARDTIYDDSKSGDATYSLHRCYLVTSFSLEAQWPEICTETYLKGELYSVTCKNRSKIGFRPNGRFIRYSIFYDVRESSEAQEKDSINVEHGECSVL